jgi:hypothetical protein
MITLKRMNKDIISNSDTFKVYIMPASASELCISIHDEYPDTSVDDTPVERTFRCRINNTEVTLLTPQRYLLDERYNYRSQQVIYHLQIDLSDITPDEENETDLLMFLLELFVVEGESIQPICMEEFILDDDSFDDNDFEELGMLETTGEGGARNAGSSGLISKLNDLIESNSRLSNQLLNIAAHLQGPVKAARTKTSTKSAASG